MSTFFFQDLDIAVKELNDRTVHGPNSGWFKLQVCICATAEMLLMTLIVVSHKSNDFFAIEYIKGILYSQVEVARPFGKNKKRAREGSSRAVTNMSPSKVFKAEPGFTSSGGPMFKVLEVG